MLELIKEKLEFIGMEIKYAGSVYVDEPTTTEDLASEPISEVVTEPEIDVQEPQHEEVKPMADVVEIKNTTTKPNTYKRRNPFGYVPMYDDEAIAKAEAERDDAPIDPRKYMEGVNELALLLYTPFGDLVGDAPTLTARETFQRIVGSKITSWIDAATYFYPEDHMFVGISAEGYEILVVGIIVDDTINFHRVKPHAGSGIVDALLTSVPNYTEQPKVMAELRRYFAGCEVELIQSRPSQNKPNPFHVEEMVTDGSGMELDLDDTTSNDGFEVESFIDELPTNQLRDTQRINALLCDAFDKGVQIQNGRINLPVNKCDVVAIGNHNYLFNVRDRVLYHVPFVVLDKNGNVMNYHLESDKRQLAKGVSIYRNSDRKTKLAGGAEVIWHRKAR